MGTGGRRSRQAINEQLAAMVGSIKAMGGLPAADVADGIWGGIWTQEAHNSTALEGNTLAMREVQLLLFDGLAAGGRQLADYMEVQGYGDASRWVYAQGLSGRRGRISITEVRHVHQMAMDPVWQVSPHPSARSDEAPGALRRHNIRAFPGGMRPPDWTDVHPQLTDWLTRTVPPKDPLAVPIAVAELHAEFERIHPFLDGNGRTGRLLMNLMLLRRGFPPAVIRNRERDRYLTALRKADDGDPQPLGEMIARASLDTGLRFVVPSVSGQDALVPLESLASEEMSVRALRAAAHRGRMKARRADGGQWLSSKAWVEEYRRSRYRRSG